MQASADSAVRVRSPRAQRLRELLVAEGATVTGADGDALEVRGLAAERIGDLAAARQMALHELTPMRASLEDAYMRLTGDSVEYRTQPAPTPGPGALEVAA